MCFLEECQVKCRFFRLHWNFQFRRENIFDAMKTKVFGFDRIFGIGFPRLCSKTNASETCIAEVVFQRWVVLLLVQNHHWVLWLFNQTFQWVLMLCWLPFLLQVAFKWVKLFSQSRNVLTITIQDSQVPMLSRLAETELTHKFLNFRSLWWCSFCWDIPAKSIKLSDSESTFKLSVSFLLGSCTRRVHGCFG